ncbi:MAG: hypothetical protein A3F40_04610 [Chlamydiae bacterium RIFCSPHIGHO2_12_FULL_27_8]|nr:MAG: hypothetical protein A3F40_04610 [Chlamydiae bacterium RIFCSPHIGHO2_12_FULL_27_8]OGN66255.1 MAG: hypothetical protein A2888_01125 [Chlamydiae bacterium RIFCSPLOWO2_01_FULL_28_7]
MQETLYKKAFKNRFFLNNLRLTIGLILLISICCFAVFGPFFSSFDYFQTNLDLKNSFPNKIFIFGSDELGRDIFVRVCQGIRISLFVGISAAILDVIIGSIWGAFSALMGGIIDNVMMRTCDIISTIPYLLWVILLSVVLGSNLTTIIITLSLTHWINMARIIRAKILVIKELPYVHAAKLIGATRKRIIFFHLLPNTIGTIVTTMTISIPVAIFTEAFLSFLGLGIQAPVASLGTMINDAIPALRYFSFRLFFPSFFLFLLMLSFNLIGDNISDLLDPKITNE